MAHRSALKRPHAFVLAPAAAAALLAFAGTPAHATGNRVLYGEVSTQDSPEAYAIALRDSAGQAVTRLAAGDYDIQIQDWAATHNFDLRQNNLSLFSSDVDATGQSSSTVTLAAGTGSFRCDAHPTIMKGGFTVVSSLAADGSGTLSPSTPGVGPGSGKTVTFTYTADPGGTGGGAITLVVPSGWSAPSTSGSQAGYVTATAGSVVASGQTITVSSINLNGGDTFTLTYGSKAQGGPGATASSGASSTWAAQERSTSDGTLTDLASQPQVTVVSADGSGSLAPSTSLVSAGADRTLAFTYTAATGGTSGGSISLTAPANWSAPSMTATAPGYVTASAGSVAVAGQTVTVSGLTLNAGDTVMLKYGDTSQGGPGATATAANGAQAWNAQEASTSGGALTALASSPQITVASADGSGTLSTTRSVVSAQQTGNTIAFTYKAATGGVAGGSVKLVVPSGWSAPSLAPQNGGYVNSSTGMLSVSSRSIIVSGITLADGSVLTLTYGARAGGGPGAKAPALVGTQTWPGSEASTSGGTLVQLTSPQITVLAPDGSGTMTTPTTSVTHSTSGLTLVFTYTATGGGTSKGTLALAVPNGWSAPSVTGTAPGCVRASRGSVSISGRSIVVGGLNLDAGAKVTIVYGTKAVGGPGATAPPGTGPQAWTSRERSWPGGALHLLASSPSITVS